METRLGTARSRESGLNAASSQETRLESLPRPSRFRKLRHCIGFRKLNRRLQLTAQVEQTCWNLEELVAREHPSFSLTMDHVNQALAEFERVQYTLFRLMDQINSFAELRQQVEYMQNNLEACVRDSTKAVQRQNRSLGRDLVCEDWDDWNEFQRLVFTLTSTVDEPFNNEILPITQQTVVARIEHARNQLSNQRDHGRFNAFVNARCDLEDLQQTGQELRFIESRAKESMKRRTVVTGVLLELCSEVRTTQRRLNKHIERLGREYDCTQSAEVLQQRDMLLELIGNAQQYDRQVAAAEQPVLAASTAESRAFARSLSISEFRHQPVYTRSWAGKTKLLTRKRTTGEEGLV